MLNRYKLAWERLEKQYPRPERVRHVIHREYAGFRERVLRQDYDFVGSIVDSLYHGDVYILHDAFDPAFL